MTCVTNNLNHIYDEYQGNREYVSDRLDTYWFHDEVSNGVVNTILLEFYHRMIEGYYEYW